MKTVKKEICNKAQELLDIIEQRKELEKREKELKKEFKNFLNGELFLDANGVLITVDSRTRKSLDKEKLSKIINLKEYETLSHYDIMTVKKVS